MQSHLTLVALRAKQEKMAKEMYELGFSKKYISRTLGIDSRKTIEWFGRGHNSNLLSGDEIFLLGWLSKSRGEVSHGFDSHLPEYRLAKRLAKRRPDLLLPDEMFSGIRHKSFSNWHAAEKFAAKINDRLDKKEINRPRWYGRMYVLTDHARTFLRRRNKFMRSHGLTDRPQDNPPGR